MRDSVGCCMYGMFFNWGWQTCASHTPCHRGAAIDATWPTWLRLPHPCPAQGKFKTHYSAYAYTFDKSKSAHLLVYCRNARSRTPQEHSRDLWDCWVHRDQRFQLSCRHRFCLRRRMTPAAKRMSPACGATASPLRCTWTPRALLCTCQRRCVTAHRPAHTLYASLCT